MNLTDFFSQTFLFKSIPKEKIENILANINPTITAYDRKKVIYSPEQYERRLGFVIRGECYIERIKNDGCAVPLNTVRAGRSFGIVSVISDTDEFPTRITASRDSEIVYLSKSDVVYIINKYPSVAHNIIHFLTDKVLFLNSKIATFSSDSVLEKLKSYLLSEYKKFGNEFNFNCKKTAEAINVGRASLYRSIEKLSEANIIKLQNKKIFISDPCGLERNQL